MIGHEVSVWLAAPKDAPLVTTLHGKHIKPVAVEWRAYWKADVDGKPFRYTTAIVFGAKDFNRSYYPGDVPAWVPSPPDGWDDAVEASWVAFQASLVVSS